MAIDNPTMFLFSIIPSTNPSTLSARTYEHDINRHAPTIRRILSMSHWTKSTLNRHGTLSQQTDRGQQGARIVGTANCGTAHPEWWTFRQALVCTLSTIWKRLTERYPPVTIHIPTTNVSLI